ncbi:MAG: MotA/TolQ/ExbB proton channel family protein [Humidesulfovibrio sp.]|jgi:chemotaxis protein MotA|nr:MotA/TolQ/ExbB proton channel family protein [Humidesulfovibrio sp.]PKN08486.1 MAG: flagellar motor protein MotA [Deltaproteobacteria bacterium HGW-Deltaproteobacteria-8]
MSKRNMLGVVLCTAVFIGGFWMSGGLALYWNLAAFIIVVAGLFASLFMSYPFARIRTAFLLCRSVYTKKQPTPDDIVRVLLELSVKSRVEGVLSLEAIRQKIGDEFLRGAVAFLVDNYKERDIREFLNTEMSFFQDRRQQSERVFQTMAKAAPAFGVAGSVIGLIGMLSGINDTQALLSSIPVAFISTLYGVVISNLILAPIAESINFNTNAEMLNQKLIMEGIIAIAKEQNSHRLEKKLTSFLSPDERVGKTELLRAITKKYITRRRVANERVAQQHTEAGEPKPFNDSVPMPQPMEMPSPGHLRMSPLASAL